MPRTTDPERVRAAWQWMMQLRDDELSPEELAAWLSWYENDPLNKEAFDAARSLWEQVPPGAMAKRAGLLSRPRPQRRRRWLQATAAVAASLCALTIGGVALQRSGPAQTPALAAAATTSAPVTLVEQTVLPDGSRVQMATRSEVSMEYSERERRMTLRKGVAYFTVAHNSDRPFIVKAGPLYIRAVGTAFNIRTAGERVVVTVAEGTVDVFPVDPGAKLETARVQAGKEILWGGDGAGATISAVDTRRALAWREGRLDYVDEPLRSAIADINRYSTRRIVIRDADVGRMRFSGSVMAAGTDEWLRALPELFPIDVLTDTDGSLVLVKRQDS